MPDITVHRGVFPIAPTPFTDAGDLDLEGQARVLDCMIDQGVDGICILANYSEQFLLTDDERDTLLDLCMERVGGRVPVIVTVIWALACFLFIALPYRQRYWAISRWNVFVIWAARYICARQASPSSSRPAGRARSSSTSSG